MFIVFDIVNVYSSLVCFFFLLYVELGKERETWKYLKTLLKVVTDIQKSENAFDGIDFV